MPDTHATALFDFSLQRQDTTVAPRTLLSCFNPATSDKIMHVGGIFLSYMATNPSPAFPLRGYRISGTEPTGGTAHDESEICRFDTQRFAPAMLVRSANPTIGTLGASFFNASPGITMGQQTSSDIQDVDTPQGFNPFVLYPGEGFVLRQDVGAAGHYWNLSVVWRELKG